MGPHPASFRGAHARSEAQHRGVGLRRGQEAYLAGLEALTPHPWDSLPADLQPGSKVSGRIVNVADYGAFMEVVPGVEGLIHVSEMSW
ncbi:S1 RNA-binding domain-containing protein, partial [Klebsiella pneumoniae]